MMQGGGMVGEIQGVGNGGGNGMGMGRGARWMFRGGEVPGRGIEGGRCSEIGLGTNCSESILPTAFKAKYEISQRRYEVMIILYIRQIFQNVLITVAGEQDLIVHV